MQRNAGIRALDWVTNASFALAGVFLIFTVVSVTVDVSLRYYFNRPLNWLTEIIETLMLYITFLGGAWVTRERGHVTVDLILARLTGRGRAWFQLAGTVVASAVCLVLTLFGFRTTWDYYVRGVHSMTVLELPVALKLAVIPVGAVLMFAQFARQVKGHWNELRETGSAS